MLFRFTIRRLRRLTEPNRVGYASSRTLAGNSPTTETSHQPKSHQRYREWTPTRVLEWATAIGPFTGRLVEAMLIHKPHPEAGYRAAMGLRPLASEYGEARLEAAATRAVRSKLYRLENLRSILKTGLDQQPLPVLVAASGEPMTHENIRGAAYYGSAMVDQDDMEVAG